MLFQHPPAMAGEPWAGKSDWLYIAGPVNEELLLRNEYLATENRIFRRQIEDRLRLTDEDRRSLSEIGKRLDKQALEEVVHIVKPGTILG